jgi:hypothetical protein
LSESPEIKPKKKNSGYTSGNFGVATNSNSQLVQNYTNPILVFYVKNDKKDEKWIMAKNYIKSLKQSEFYMI